MPLYPLLIFILVMALLCWGISVAPFIGPRWKNILYWIVGIFAAFWIADFVGLIGYLRGVGI